MNETERKAKLREVWDNLKPFSETYDIPEPPRVDKEEWESYYIPRLIALGAIPKSQLIDGQEYVGKTRGTTNAVWNKDINQFVYTRHKFGFEFPDYVNHFEDDDGYALFVPIKIKE